jgi:aminomethyltransferase
MTESTRTSALADRHRALGSDLGDWNGMGVAWSYASDPCDEHDAVRTAAGIFDVSGLKKVHVRGPDSTAVVDHIITRNMSVIYPGKSAYGPLLTEEGTICDDAIIANQGNDHWMVVHGSGECMERLQESAQGKNVDIEFDDNLHDISLQGPKAVDFLNSNTPMDLPSLKYFHHQETELFGHPCTISRTGYSGERGYEIFANADVIGDIWDQIVGQGASEGIMPCSFTCLDKIRVEAALLFYPYDMTKENTPWEVGLDWALSRKKGDFRGRDAVFASQGKEKIRFAGIVADHDDILAGGEQLLLDGKQVGTVNSPAYSHRMKKSLALVHLTPEAAKEGTVLQVVGEGLTCAATVSRVPFYDPEKTRTHG